MSTTFIWQEFIDLVSKKIPPEKFKAWIEPLEFVELNERNLVVAAENQFSVDWVPQMFGPVFREILLTHYGMRSELKIELSLSERPASDSSAMLTFADAKSDLKADSKTEAAAQPPHSFPENQEYHAEFDVDHREDVREQIEQENILASNIISSRALGVSDGYHALSVKDLKATAIRTIAQPLNPKHSFQTYVVGTNNQFAHAAARAVAENPARQYNPLFIYSHSGLGKTHLMHAIGNHILKLNPRARICYLSAEKFVNDLIEGIQRGTQSQFRQKYREGYDVLLMDDIQFIANKPTSMEEFFHTFNALQASDKQIVVASDRFPKDIPGLEDRIRSRFECGLVVEIQSPDIETRIAILRAKAEQDDIYLPNDVALFLASNIKSNVRELEGALLRLGAKASLLGVEISLDLAKQELQNLIKHPTETTFNTDVIVDAVSKHFSVKVSEIKGKDRSRRIAVPRQITMYLLRKYCKKSYPDIGAILGGKDHSTILHGERKIVEAIDSDPNIKKHIEEIQASL